MFCEKLDENVTLYAVTSDFWKVRGQSYSMQGIIATLVRFLASVSLVHFSTQTTKGVLVIFGVKTLVDNRMHSVLTEFQ